MLLKQLKGKMKYRRGVLREHGACVKVAVSAAAEKQHKVAEDVGIEQLHTNFGTLVGEDGRYREDNSAMGTADISLMGKEETEEPIDDEIVRVKMLPNAEPRVATHLTAAYKEYKQFQSEHEPW